MKTARQQSPQAQVAKIVKKHLTGLGIKCRASSDSFSMGNSVTVDIQQDVSPSTAKMIKEYCGQFQYGHFDGMQDMYEYSNSRSDIPQTKYIHANISYSDELKQKAWDWMRERLADLQDAPADRVEGSQFRLEGAQCWGSDALNGSDSWSEDFWAQWEIDNSKPKVSEIPATTSTTATIEEHTHTKKGFQMFIVIPADRLERDAFTSLRTASQELGGWYSRKWGSTPGGFAFKELALAEEFVSCYFGGDAPDNPPKTRKPADLSEKFRTLADKMQDSIDSKFADRQTNTAKRMAQAAHARLDGEKLQRTQAVLYSLADLHESGELPDILAGITSKKQVFDRMGSKSEPIANGFHSYYVETGEPSSSDPVTLALWELLTPKTEEQKQAEEMEGKINGLQFSSIPGYFPTPNAVIETMIDYAQLDDSMRVLEPSAGSGAICDKVAPLCKEVKALEINYTLAEILDAKDYLIEKSRDFLSVEPGELTSYERVLMNPPFENLQHIDHIRHAFKFLSDGGRLVSVLPPLNSLNKCAMFRDWVEELGGEFVELPANSFKESGTNVATQLLILDKG